MGVQIPHRLGAQISTKGIVWQGSAEGWRDYPRARKAWQAINGVRIETDL
jgi:hypothetical protein